MATTEIKGGPSKPVEPRAVEGESAIQDSRPGSTKTPVHFEGLGNLDDFPDHINMQDVEGVGTQCVVLTDILSGAGGETYTKGQIHRISKLVPDYDHEDKDIPKSNIRRLMSLGAIRPATPEEIKAGFATITMDSESEATQTERAKRLELESENERLRAQLNVATGKAGADPAPTGKKAGDPFEGE